MPEVHNADLAEQKLWRYFLFSVLFIIPFASCVDRALKLRSTRNHRCGQAGSWEAALKWFQFVVLLGPRWFPQVGLATSGFWNRCRYLPNNVSFRQSFYLHLHAGGGYSRLGELTFKENQGGFSAYWDRSGLSFSKADINNLSAIKRTWNNILRSFFYFIKLNKSPGKFLCLFIHFLKTLESRPINTGWLHVYNYDRSHFNWLMLLKKKKKVLRYV